MSIPLRHIAVICPSCGGGGSVAAVALKQAAGLVRSFDVTLVSDSHPAEPIARVEHFRISPPPFNWLRRYGHVPREIAFTKHVRRGLFSLARIRNLDFILCHGHATAALAAAPVQESLGVPYGLVTHGDIFDRPRGTYDTRLTWFYRSVTPTAYRRANLVVALSPYMAACAEKGGAAKDAIRAIPNGIDPKELGLDGVASQPLARANCSSVLRILVVGRLSVEKGVDTLFQACKLLAVRNIPFQLRLVGDGSLRSDLEAMATRLGLNDAICFVGHLPRHELGREYLACHLVCVPSRSEALPTVALEAMAAGRPVIGTNTGGISFVVEHGKTGVLVAPEAPDELANALEWVKRNPHILVEMGRRGFQECHRRFNWDEVIQQLAEAIDETILSSNPPPMRTMIPRRNL